MRPSGRRVHFTNVHWATSPTGSPNPSARSLSKTAQAHASSLAWRFAASLHPGPHLGGYLPERLQPARSCADTEGPRCVPAYKPSHWPSLGTGCTRRGRASGPYRSGSFVNRAARASRAWPRVSPPATSSVSSSTLSSDPFLYSRYLLRHRVSRLVPVAMR
jgi:hypothetical protein